MMATTITFRTTISIILLSIVVHGFGGIQHRAISTFRHQYEHRSQQVDRQRQQNPDSTTCFAPTQRRRRVVLSAKDDDDDDDDDEADDAVGQGPNWIERSLPVGIGSSIRIQRGFESSDGDGDDDDTSDKVDDYNLGISGVSFGTGTLGKRMYDAIVSQNRFGGNMDETIRKALTMYALDFTAKEATRAALKQNGLDMVLTKEQEDIGMWGQVDSIRLLHPTTQQPLPKVYDSVEEALEDWTPGQAFDFVVRQVPAKLRALDLSELLQALDPDGTLRKSAKDANMTLPDEDDDDDDNEALQQAIKSLEDLANESVRRSEQAPRDVATKSPFTGKLEQRGYRIMKRSDLLKENANPDGTEQHQTLMHVMDALVSHGCLVVDVSDGGTNYEPAWAMAKMWNTVEQFFDDLQNDESKATTLPSMTSVLDSPYAKVGYAAYDNGSMQFLETRWQRTGENVVLYPTEAADILEETGTIALKTAFDLVTDVGKNVVRIATAASSVELEGFSALSSEGPSLSGISGLSDDDGDDDETTYKVLASEAATLLANELMDDGKPLLTTDIAPQEGSVSMSPHRICRYTDLREKKVGDDQQEKEPPSSKQREIFGAHTDSSFVTIVPVAAISGLEVFDEAAERWLRPELLARRTWEQERKARGEDPNALYETTASSPSDGNDASSSLLPWHARYVVIMPGEFLQIVTRNEVPAAVHRVVAAKGDARLSAPILLRGRPGTKLDVNRYLGALNHPLLAQCDGMSMEQIHQAMQPTSFE